MIPPELARFLGQKWPCRDLQIKQLASLLSPGTPSPQTLVVYGIPETCKSTIIRAVLSSFSSSNPEGARTTAPAPVPAVPHTIIRCSECITGKHLLTKVLWGVLEALGLEGEWERFGKGRCEHVCSLVAVLGECLGLASLRVGSEVNGEGENWRGRPGMRFEKFVLVLDGIDKQREVSQTLLSALARLGEVVPSLCVVLVLSSTPRPLFLQSAAVPHVSFPPYSREEAIIIVLSSGPPSVEHLPFDVASKIYPHFVSTVYDSLVGPTAGTIPMFRSICEKLWPQFVSPVVEGDVLPPGGNDGTEWDFSRLLVRNRAMFRRQGESVLVHHIVPPEPSIDGGGGGGGDAASTSILSASTLPPRSPPSLPYVSTLVLTSAYLAAHIPSRLDTIFFSKFYSSSLSARNKRAHHRRRLKRLSRPRIQNDDDNDFNNNDQQQDPSTPRSSRKGKRQTRITKSTLESAFATSSAKVSGDTGAAAAGVGINSTGITGPSTILSARPFPLERIIAIYHAIDPNPPANPARVIPVADVVYAELATLRRLRLLVPASGSGGATGNTTVDTGEKWCVNVSGDWIGEVAKGVGVEVGEWLAGGLD